MRVSIDEKDPGFAMNTKDFINVAYCEVYLNGSLDQHCITADEEKGYALMFKLDADGRPQYSFETEEFQTMEFHGKVEIRLRHTEDGSWPHGVKEV